MQEFDRFFSNYLVLSLILSAFFSFICSKWPLSPSKHEKMLAHEREH